jgi:hypothetical protein
MNSPNLQPRQFVHNTCELSIDDKKSPFPAWMKFNKPNPLRFALTVNDPDRPELEPMRVEGDRTKLEALHRTVDNYVKGLLARAPLPQINGEDLGKIPQDNSVFSENFSSTLHNRPIDALQVNDDQPRIEADGLSRHLFYLGNGADANTTTMSLSTLQLFDLSSALGEGMTPVLDLELEPEKSVAVAKEIETFVQPVVLPPETVTDHKNSVITSHTADKSEVAEPRVVLPSVNAKEAKASEDLYGLETESSILERANPPTRDRFNMPKPSLASLNLPELPDFSRSPLTSIPLWLGLGSMAALIMAFPWLSNQFKNGSSVAKKPEAPPVQVATAPTDIPTPYQPTDTVVQNGLGTPSANGLPITLPPSNQTTGIGIGGTTPPNPISNPKVKVPPNPSISNNIIGGTAQNNNISGNNNRSSYSGTDQRLSPQTIESSNTAAMAQKNREKAIADAAAKRLRKGTDSESAGRNNEVSQQLDDYDPRLPLIDTSKPKAPKKSPKSSSDSNATPPDLERPSALGPLVADGAVSNPVPRSKAPNNTFSQESQIRPPESVQASGLRSYFQSFWRADPKFGESLQYKVSVDGNGKVLSVGGDDEKSRTYLSKTGFLKPGETVSKKGSQSQKILLILHSTGDVEALPDTE